MALFSPLASGHPDGLEFVAEQQGFLTIAADSPYSILPDYTIPFIGNPAVTTILAVLVGTLVVFGLALLLGRLTTRRQSSGD